MVGGRTVRAIIYVPPEKFSSLQWPLRGHCKLETNRTNRGAKRKALFTRAGGMGTLKYYINGVSLVGLFSIGVRLFLSGSFFTKLVFMGGVTLDRAFKIFCPGGVLYFSEENIIYGMLSLLWGRGAGQCL